MPLAVLSEARDLPPPLDLLALDRLDHPLDHLPLLADQTGILALQDLLVSQDLPVHLGLLGHRALPSDPHLLLVDLLELLDLLALRLPGSQDPLHLPDLLDLLDRLVLPALLARPAPPPAASLPQLPLLLLVLSPVNKSTLLRLPLPELKSLPLLEVPILPPLPFLTLVHLLFTLILIKLTVPVIMTLLHQSTR